eukprot:117109-Rhodomonas_salina.1
MSPAPSDICNASFHLVSRDEWVLRAPIHDDWCCGAAALRRTTTPSRCQPRPHSATSSATITSRCA